MVYALGHVSGGHFNPAVTLGLWSAGRFGPARVIPYWIAQVAGAILAAAVLYLVASGKTGFDLAGGFRSEEHTSELQSLMRISYAVFCLKTKTITTRQRSTPHLLHLRRNN